MNSIIVELKNGNRFNILPSNKFLLTKEGLAFTCYNGFYESVVFYYALDEILFIKNSFTFYDSADFEEEAFPWIDS